METKKQYRIAVIPGDGTGPEVTQEAVKALQALPSNEEFEVHVCDAAGVSIASRKFIYGEFYRGDKPPWTSPPMPEGTEASGDFSIFANMNSRQTPGVYVGYDTDGGAEANFSMVGTPGALQPAKFREGNNETTNWCIRCVIHKKP